MRVTGPIAMAVADGYADARDGSLEEWTNGGQRNGANGLARAVLASSLAELCVAREGVGCSMV